MAVGQTLALKVLKMAYNKADLERQALEAIKEHNLMFVTDVPAYLACSIKTFYNKELQELQSIKDALERNRVKVKNGLRAKWYKSENATVQIALYKLIGTEEEAHRLNGTRQDITTNGESLSNITITIQRAALPIISEDDIAEDIA